MKLAALVSLALILVEVSCNSEINDYSNCDFNLRNHQPLTWSWIQNVINDLGKNISLTKKEFDESEIVSLSLINRVSEINRKIDCLNEKLDELNALFDTDKSPENQASNQLLAETSTTAYCHPCENGGICQDDGTCLCTPMYSGTFCTESICQTDDPCELGSTCTITSDFENYQCACVGQYIGQNCTVYGPPTTSSNASLTGVVSSVNNPSGVYILVNETFNVLVQSDGYLTIMITPTPNMTASDQYLTISDTSGTILKNLPYRSDGNYDLTPFNTTARTNVIIQFYGVSFSLTYDLITFDPCLGYSCGAGTCFVDPENPSLPSCQCPVCYIGANCETNNSNPPDACQSLGDFCDPGQCCYWPCSTDPPTCTPCSSTIISTTND